MPSFSDIEFEIRAVVDSAEDADSDPEAQASFDAYLDELAAQEAGKADSIAFVIRNMESREEFLRKRAEEINAKARSLHKQKERLRDYVLATMEANGLKRIKGDTYTLSLRSSQAVRIDDETRIPIEYMQVSAEPMRTEIRAALNEGRKVPGASLVENVSLMVR